MGCSHSNGGGASVEPSLNQLDGMAGFAGFYKLSGGKVPDGCGAFFGVSAAYTYKGPIPVIPVMTVTWSLDGTSIAKEIKVGSTEWDESSQTLTLDDSMIHHGAKLRFSYWVASQGSYSMYTSSFEGELGSLGKVTGSNPIGPMPMSRFAGTYYSPADANPNYILDIDKHGFSTLTANGGTAQAMLPLEVILNITYAAQGYTFIYGAGLSGRVMAINDVASHETQNLTTFNSDKADEKREEKQQALDSMAAVRRWLHSPSQRRGVSPKEQVMELVSKRAALRAAIASEEDDSAAISKVVDFECDFFKVPKKDKESQEDEKSNEEKVERMSEYSGFYLLDDRGENAFVCVMTEIVSTPIYLSDGSPLDVHYRQMKLSVCVTGKQSELTVIEWFEPEWLTLDDGWCTLTIPESALLGGAVLTFTHVCTKGGVLNTVTGTIGEVGVYGTSLSNYIPLWFFIGTYFNKDNEAILKIEKAKENGKNELPLVSFDFQDGNGLQPVKNFVNVPDMYLIGFKNEKNEKDDSTYMGDLSATGLSMPHIAGQVCALTHNGNVSFLCTIPGYSW